MSSRNPQVPNTTTDTQYNVRDAALRGASSAFSKPPVKPKPQVNTYTGGNNGALLAATKVGTTGTTRNARPGTASPLRRDGTGGSSWSASRPNPLPMQLQSKSSSSSTLGVPEDHLADRTPSPSNIAAKLAAARYSPRKPLPHASPMSIVRERDTTDRDVLPPMGSVGDLLVGLDSRQQTQPPPPPPTRSRRVNSPDAISSASTVRVAVEDYKPTDDTPIPPTTSLVNLFEQNRPSTPLKGSTTSISVSKGAQPPVRSPKPRRTFTLPPEPEDRPLDREKTNTPPPIKPKSQVEITTAAGDGPRDQSSFSMLRKDSLGTPPTKQKPAQLSAIRTKALRPMPPAQRGSRKARPRSHDLTRSPSFHAGVSSSMDSNENASSPTSFVSAPEEQEEERPKPSLPPPRRSGRAKPEAAPSETRPRSSYTPNIRAPSQITSPMTPPERFPRRQSASAVATSPTNTMYHSNYQRESVKAIAKHLTGESLSNAIVGAALASSRNASPVPSMTPAPLLPIRRQHHHSPFHPSRSPSPPKPTGKMRSTMRKEKSSSSDEDESERYKKKGTRIMGMRRKHPNKHHEGTRKRWRDAITERERKRYEGVWAANKGLYIPPPTHTTSQAETNMDSALDILNLVAKEIWTRSRLPEHDLEEVWSLVDSRGLGRLKREEFVVGMWLIDQRLKGRKLPIRVTESVWDSVRGVGVKVKLVPLK